MKVLFLDASPTVLAKNLLPIANWFQKKSLNFEALFVSLDISSYTDKKVEKQSLDKIIKENKYRFISFNSLNHNRIKKFLIVHNPDLIFINGYRIFDQLWIGIGKSLNIPTYKLQQGFEVKSVYYKVSAIVSKFHKGIKMLYALNSLSKILNGNFFKVFAQYLQYLFRGKPLRNSLLDNKLLRPEKVFVYSNFYKQFWNEKFGFEYDKMVLITPIDFLLIPQIRAKKKEKACCYIAQTLVEDGRMNKKAFLKLMNEYKTIASKIEKFIIKLHPRSNIKFYDSFKELRNVEFTREFPNCTAYLTHYSSMIFTASFLSDTVILHELEGHPTPEIFNKVAFLKTSNIKKIENVLLNTSKVKEPDFEERKKEIDFYAVYEKINPYDKIFQHLTFNHR